ncbi:MAG: AsmA family protein [Bryobacteraceae bacterium]
MKRGIIVALLLILAVGFAAPHFEIDFFRPKIARALERGLGRRVEVGAVHFNLFTGPGFTVDDVTIHEDPRVGIEPFAYVGTLEARVQLLSLLRHRLDFSSLRLADASINLVKTDAGPWNFQFLLSNAPASAGAMPAIKMRGGRVHFKFGDTKSVFYFRDADFDVAPSMDGSVELRFVGAPSRSDRSAQDFGHFFVRGVWSAQKVEMRVELEKSALEEVARLIDRRGFGLHGVVALDAQLSGPPSHLSVTGNIQVNDVHRWDLLPQSGGGLRVGYQGTLDLHNDRLELESVADLPDPQVAASFQAWDYLRAPHWEASAQLKKVPVATVLEIARHMGAAVPQEFTAEGSVSGEVRYSEADGIAGKIALQDASVTLPDARPLRAASAAVVIDHQVMSLEPSTVSVGENESADVEGSFSLEGAGRLDLKITTRGLSVADMRGFGVAAIPLLDQTPQGSWRGWARYEWARDEAGRWSGEYELLNARIPVDGLAEPVRVQTAAVSLNGKRVAVNRIRAKVGGIAFSGDYRWEPGAIRPHKFHLLIPEADASELQRALAPTLVRDRGFFARTLRLADAPAPDWLKARRADGTVTIGTLTFGETQVHIDTARLVWDAALVRLAGLSAHFDQASLVGDLQIDLAGGAPHYRFEGKLNDLAYMGGKLDFEGSADTDGTGPGILAGAHAEGRVHGRSITFSPEVEFRTGVACFEVSEQGQGERWKLSSVEVTQGADTYTGSGATQSDGRLVLDLLSRGRLVHYSALLAAGTP